MQRLLLVTAGSFAALAVSRYIVGSWDSVVVIAVLLAVFAMERFMRTNGHAANAKIWALGMPKFLVVFYILILGLVVFLMWPHQGFHPQTNANFLAVGLAALTGWLVGLVDWYTLKSSKGD